MNIPEHAPSGENCWHASGKVYLIGAGPGDPKLMTLRAAELLSQADVVLYDYLVNPAIVAHAPGTAERICLGKHGRTRIWTQAEINAQLVTRARSGQTVVRLKGGDPNLFGRLMEEIECLVEAEIPFEIVPGISAASAACAYAGVPLTSRRSAASVAFVTGHESEKSADTQLDFSQLASFPGTLVVYMGVTTAERWVRQLIEHRKAPDTPVALIRRCSLPDQRIVRCRLSEVPDRLTPYSKFPPPVIAIVGEVARVEVPVHGQQLRPLFGRLVLVTRPIETAVETVHHFESLGATVVLQPAIAVGPAADPQPLHDAIQHLQQYQWLVFCSANGVRFFFDALNQQAADSRRLATCRVAATGTATADALRRYGIRADVVPKSFRAEDFAAALREPVRGQRVLILRASRSRTLLAERLAETASEVHQVVAYENRDVQAAETTTLNMMDDGRIDWVVVMSSATARSVVRMFGERLNQTHLASISPVTSATLRELGHLPQVEADQQSLSSISESICRWHRKQQGL